jgi:arylsulfatase A-like enzyme
MREKFAEPKIESERPRCTPSGGRLSSFLGAWVIACLIQVGAAGAADRPNVILLMGDDHGWEETGYNGHAFLKTPVLDEMAATGLRMDHFYAAHPSCSPTRGSVLTGRHPNRYGTFTPGHSLRPEEITIAHLVRKAGYATGHFGKWHVGTVKKGSPTNPGAMGFDEWLSHDNFFELNPVMSRNGGPPKKIMGESSEVVVDAAIDFIGKVKEKPFFTIIWFGSPHEPYQGLEKDMALYRDLPARYSEKTVSLTSNETGRRTKRPLRDVLIERYAEITAMDRAIGKLRDFLKKAGLRDNTLLWYCGDNGTPPSGLAETPLRGLKGKMYEGGIRVPGVIEWPARISKPRWSKVNAVTSDMLPTICALVGQEVPDRPLDGINLEPMLDGKMKRRAKPIQFWAFSVSKAARAKRKPYLDPELQKGTTPLVKLMGDIPTRNFVNYHHPGITEADFKGQRVILDDRYKLVIDGEKGSGTELFDLRKDLAEENNLFGSKPAVAKKLAGQLRAWQGSVLKSLMGGDY